MSLDTDIHVALREMTGKIGGLISTVDDMKHQWQSQESNATQGRRDLHQKMDATRLEVAGLSTQVNTVVRDLSSIQPDVQAFRNREQQAKGAEKLGRRLFALIGMLGTLFGGALGWAVSNYITIGPKPPLH